MGKSTYTTNSLRLGYARVSTDDQDMALQLDALAKVQCDRVFSEKASSGKERPQLEECLRTLRRGDVLTVWRLDRLGRSMTELVAIVNDLASRGVTFESLTEHIDTSSASGKFAFHLFSALAEFERNTIKERTRAGLAAARARGRMGGRPAKVTPKAKREMKALYTSQEVSVKDICTRYNITRSTFYRVVLERDYRANEKA
ncbi:recombinase family protein [Xylella fastidiosa]|uniref:DNA invertase n=1 Tax=Xylella fastidiosa subsp. sandyi Ann-1 TaxID=155920 RepID=A0A060H4J7_XYLFS|nr:recombinase family protein [Xylella fastidiosa]AIC11704.1 DNA invertase [Xylella fastidiosa subsp. sandyi Ann-1]UIX82644.1 recombinase family protein [Xylella fastidiosa subsp. sandyi]